jgi:hypothetical protein
MFGQQVKTREEGEFIDVRVVNPSKQTRTRKLSRTNLKQLELFAEISSFEEGEPRILTLGCGWNGSWVPLRLKEKSKWWDRLSRVPARRKMHVPRGEMLVPVLSVKSHNSRSQQESSQRLTTLPKRLLFTHDEQPVPRQINPTKSSVEDNTWWDRLSELTPQKINSRREIYNKYEEFLKKFTTSKCLKKKKQIRSKQHSEITKVKQLINDVHEDEQLVTQLELDKQLLQYANEEKQLMNKVKERAVSELLDILTTELEESDEISHLDIRRLSTIEEQVGESGAEEEEEEPEAKDEIPSVASNDEILKYDSTSSETDDEERQSIVLHTVAQVHKVGEDLESGIEIPNEISNNCEASNLLPKVQIVSPAEMSVTHVDVIDDTKALPSIIVSAKSLTEDQ